jgi:D-glycero-D-manno-heptose 1,7-bisphosphate phosphatase
MKLIILDRDGTLNEDRDDFVKSPDEWQPIEGALEAVARLNQAGWRVVVASNQSGIGRGLFGVSELNAIHTKMHSMLAEVGAKVDAVFFCPHAPGDGCTCRKPLPGLFEQIALRYGIDLKGVPTVGDSVRDLRAGAAVGCALHAVRTGRAELSGHKIGESAGPQALPDGVLVHDNLAACVDHLLLNI